MPVKLSSAARLATTLLCGALCPLVAVAAYGQEATPKPQSDLDTFMERVLARRDENWKKLHDYILSETERFAIVGPGKVSLYGFRREFSWYVRDGYLIRSPIRFDGVTISETQRRRYEENWLSEEKSREERKSTKAAEQAAQSKGEEGQPVTPDTQPSLESILSGRVEPRFVSEAYFLQFKFEPGNYYFVGREQLNGREVLRIEYYPTHLFQDEEHAQDKEKQAAKPDKQTAKERQMEDRIQRGLNKVALVTLWIEPTEYQIVRYTFDNVDFGFLPGRWLVRVDDVKASMTMSKVLDGVWLPGAITMEAGLSLASGSYHFEYGRQFYDHKKAEVSARIRSIGGDR
jgi:hypothetical protein